MHRLNNAADVVGQDFGQNLQRVGFSLRPAFYLFSRSQPLTLSLFLANLTNSWTLYSRSVSLAANHGAVQVTVFALLLIVPLIDLRRFLGCF